MPRNASSQRWSIQKRLEFVDFRLFWDGHINRGDLVDTFGISVPQASMDLRNYQEAAPGNIEYDKKSKAYVARLSYQPVFFTPSADHFFAQLRLFAAGVLGVDQLWIGSMPPFAALPVLRRRADPTTLRQILVALRNKLSMNVRYQSFTSPASRWRWISPHALAFDGFRWHVRAWCHNRMVFHDFVLARLLEIGDERPSNVDSSHDVGWNTELVLRIGPHPDMQEGARRAIELDYGMSGGVVEVTTRVCLVHYLKRQLGLDRDPAKNEPWSQQIILINGDEVDSAVKKAEPNG